MAKLDVSAAPAQLILAKAFAVRGNFLTIRYWTATAKAPAAPSFTVAAWAPKRPFSPARTGLSSRIPQELDTYSAWLAARGTKLSFQR